jgi:hypothetical protein
MTSLSTHLVSTGGPLVTGDTSPQLQVDALLSQKSLRSKGTVLFRAINSYAISIWHFPSLDRN